MCTTRNNSRYQGALQVVWTGRKPVSTNKTCSDWKKRKQTWHQTKSTLSLSQKLLWMKFYQSTQIWQSKKLCARISEKKGIVYICENKLDRLWVYTILQIPNTPDPVSVIHFHKNMWNNVTMSCIIWHSPRKCTQKAMLLWNKKGFRAFGIYYIQWINNFWSQCESK